MSSNFNCSYMAMSSLTYILGYIFSSETAEPNYTKAGRNGPWVGPFQNCVRQPCPPFKMAAITKNREIEISSIVHCCFIINQNGLKL